MNHLHRKSWPAVFIILAVWNFQSAAAESPFVISPKRQITTVDSRHPEVVRADNGDLVVAFSGSEGKGHDRSDQHIMVIISADGGKAWSKPVDVYPPDGVDRAMIKDPYLMVAPDGTIVCSYDNPATQNTGSISISRDHGRTWEFLGRISRDKGKTWTDYTPVTDRDTRDEYSGFAECPDGRGGYLVWGENAVLFGATVRPAW